LSRIVSLLCISCIAASFAFAAQGAVSGASRGALWQVIQACLINHALTGAAFPCLEVNVSGGNERGYAILRPPLGAADLILAPTRRIVGVEDPSLEALDAPNYFEDAWNARRFLQRGLKRPLQRDDVVLAVNSRQSRTQDQLHIHIGCLSPKAMETIRLFAPALSESRWIPLGRSFHGLEFWGRLVVAENLIGVNPFRLAAEAWPEQFKDRSQLTIAVAGIRLSDRRDGFVLLASYDNPLGQFSAEDFLDYSASRCQ
jgi:CDP-diacylglycerol pyrophosphatase